MANLALTYADTSLEDLVKVVEHFEDMEAAGVLVGTAKTLSDIAHNVLQARLISALAV